MCTPKQRAYLKELLTNNLTKKYAQNAESIIEVQQEVESVMNKEFINHSDIKDLEKRL
jgi:hypothetical protein